jgi:hypothetical protein
MRKFSFVIGMNLSQCNHISKFSHLVLTHLFYWAMLIHFCQILIKMAAGLCRLLFYNYQIFLLCLFLENFYSLRNLSISLTFYAWLVYLFVQLIIFFLFRLTSIFLCFLSMKNAFRFDFCFHGSIIEYWFLNSIDISRNLNI